MDHSLFNAQISKILYLAFSQGKKIKSWSIIQDTDWRSILSSSATSASVEWVPGWSPWLRIISSTSLMFSSARTNLGHPEPFFRDPPPVSSIFSNSFITRFIFWMVLNNYCSTYLHFISRYLIIIFSSCENTISVVTNNLI